MRPSMRARRLASRSFERYIARVRAFNGVCSKLVTKDGATVRDGNRHRARIGTDCVSHRDGESLYRASRFGQISEGRPSNLAAWSRPRRTASVHQQFGMIVGIPNAGQVNALATLNIRGERSVTCKGDFDLHPSKGPLPPAAPPICDIFDICRMHLSKRLS